MTHQLKYSFSLDLVPEFGSVFFNSIRVLPKHKFKTSLKQLLLKQPLLTPSVKKVPSVTLVISSLLVLQLGGNTLESAALSSLIFS